MISMETTITNMQNLINHHKIIHLILPHRIQDHMIVVINQINFKKNLEGLKIMKMNHQMKIKMLKQLLLIYQFFKHILKNQWFEFTSRT